MSNPIPAKEELRAVVRANLGVITGQVNLALRGKVTPEFESALTHLGRGGNLPTWYPQLAKEGTLPNLDGKTIGSVVEMLLVAVLETHAFKGMELPPLKINPARGVDLPDLDLSVKSPSENFCTSEPFFSPYERLFGSEYDALVLLTDYQKAKKTPPLKLQITAARYLDKSQIADRNLCNIARKHREWLLGENESWARRVFRFLAYINQSDWRAKRLLKLTEHLRDNAEISNTIKKARVDFSKSNKARAKKGKQLIPDNDIQALETISDTSPHHVGVIDALDNWLEEVLKDAARPPNENEWNRLKSSPLDGQLGLSFAFQWRYNFSKIFTAEEAQASGQFAEKEEGDSE